MLYRIKTIDGVKTKVPLAGSTPAGLPVGSILSTYKKIQPYNYLYCDGSTFDENQYPALYLYLGTNVLPDYRECVMVGAEKNTTNIFDSTETDPSTGLPGTQSHDVFSQGEFKDDQIQNHTHAYLNSGFEDYGHLYGGGGYGSNATQQTQNTGNTGRYGTTTRTKEKAVFVYIKAVDGVDIADEDYFLDTVKNFVEEKNSYSTEEMLTGGKWIDGKPIYRRVINTTVSGGYNTTTNGYYSWESLGFAEMSTFSVSTMIDAFFIGVGSERGDNKINKNCVMVFNRGANYNQAVHQVNSGYDGFKALQLVIEYTKTTD